MFIFGETKTVNFNIMKAIVTRNAGGILLVLPKSGKAPMLFLEAIAPISLKTKNIVHHVENNMFDDTLDIRINLTGEQIKEIATYINNNL